MIKYQWSYIIYHLSNIIFHISYFIYLLSYIIFHIFYITIIYLYLFFIYHHHISSSYIIITYHHHISYHYHLPSQWKPITITVASNTGIFSQGSSVKNILECRTVFDRVRPESVFDMAQRMFKSFSTHFVGHIGIFLLQGLGSSSCSSLSTILRRSRIRLHADLSSGRFEKHFECLWILWNAKFHAKWTYMNRRWSLGVT